MRESVKGERETFLSRETIRKCPVQRTLVGRRAANFSGYAERCDSGSQTELDLSRHGAIAHVYGDINPMRLVAARRTLSRNALVKIDCQACRISPAGDRYGEREKR